MVRWTALITGYSQNDRPEQALRLFLDMLRLELKPNSWAFAILLKACGATRTDANGRQIHAFCIKYGGILNVYVVNSLVDMYARRGDMKEAHLVFDALDSKSVVSWNALIGGYAREGNGEAAVMEFCKMHRGSFKATRFTFSVVLSACTSMGALEQGKWVHALVIKSGEKHDTVVNNNAS